MFRKGLKFIVNNTLGFLYGLAIDWTWKTVGGAVVLASIVSGFLSWWEGYPISNTTLIFLGAFLCFMTVALYRQKAGKKTRAQEVIAEVKEFPASPNAATLMPDLAKLWTCIDNEMWWTWPSNETIDLYRKIEQDFRALQRDLDEDTRAGIQEAIVEAREILREKIKDI